MTRRALAHMGSVPPEYGEALRLLHEAQSLKPNAIKQYNIACCHALMGSTRAAVDCLQSAVDGGYTDHQYVLADEDLAILQDDPQFQALVQGLQAAHPPESTLSLAEPQIEASRALAASDPVETAAPATPEAGTPATDEAEVEADDVEWLVPTTDDATDDAPVASDEWVDACVVPEPPAVQADSLPDENPEAAAPEDAGGPGQGEELTEEQRKCLYKLHEMGFLDDAANLRHLQGSDWVLTRTIAQLLA